MTNLEIVVVWKTTSTRALIELNSNNETLCQLCDIKNKRIREINQF